MEVYAINTGYIKMKGGFYLYPGLKDKNRYPVLVFLIKVDGKTILFDTGISDKVENKIGVFSKFLFLENLQESSLDKQLDLLEVSVDDIDYVINSHLHFDHCSGNYLFKDKKILIQSEELTSFIETKKNPMYIPFSESENNSFTQIHGTHDIFGDNIAHLVPAYGHSNGHQILTIEYKDNFLIFLADSCYTKEDTLLPIEVESMNNYSISVESVNCINDIIRRNENKKVKLFFSHDFCFDDISNKDGEIINLGIKKYTFG